MRYRMGPMPCVMTVLLASGQMVDGAEVAVDVGADVPVDDVADVPVDVDVLDVAESVDVRIAPSDDVPESPVAA